MRAPFLAHVSRGTLGMAYLAVVHILLKSLPFTCPSAKRTPYFLRILFADRKYISCKDYALTTVHSFSTRKILLFGLLLLGSYVIFYDFSHLFPFFVTYTSQFNGMATIMLYIETMAFLANRRPEWNGSPTLV